MRSRIARSNAALWATQEQCGLAAAASTTSGIGCPGTQVSIGPLPQAKPTQRISVVGMFGVSPRADALFPLSQLGGAAGFDVPVEGRAVFGSVLACGWRIETRLRHDWRRGFCRDMRDLRHSWRSFHHDRGVQHPRDEIAHAHLLGSRTICHSFVSRRRVWRGISQPCLARISARPIAFSRSLMALGPKV